MISTGQRPVSRAAYMDFLKNNLLTILIFLPTLGAILTLIPKSRDAIRWTALITCLLTFVLSLLLFALFDWHASGGYAYAQFTPDGAYIPGSGTVQLVNNSGLGTDWIKI